MCDHFFRWNSLSLFSIPGQECSFARLYLFRAVKLTSRSTCDGESTSLFRKECCWRLEAGSTSKSASIELRLSVSEDSRILLHIHCVQSHSHHVAQNGRRAVMDNLTQAYNLLQLKSHVTIS